MIITGVEEDDELAVMKAKMLGSLLFFTQTFFKLRTGRDFALSQPVSRESHHITICRELTRVFRLETARLLINVPPGHFKSTLLQHFIAWCWAHYPDCQFLYLSYSHDEAAKNTAIIKTIVSLPEYKQFFGVEVDSSSSAKDDFKTNFGGTIKAFGSGGAVTGKDAGFPHANRFSGALIMDDMHKPDEVHSDTIREGVIQNYEETIAQRIRGPKVAQIFLGQRLHELDLAQYFKDGKDGHEWNQVVLKGLDEHENALDENVKTRGELITMRERRPYVFASQYQQDPQPAGGAIFKENSFVYLDEEPKILATFITADTAETDKTYNDPSVFSLWGIYKINDTNTHDIGVYALHWMECVQGWWEPKDLRDQFMKFYVTCCRNSVTPRFAAIEKKSTGVTLLSVLQSVRGLQTWEIERTRASGSKTTRFLEIQDIVNQKLISFTAGAKHAEMCIKHCAKITANDTHAHDDIADTMYDAIKLALIDKHILVQFEEEPSNVVAEIAASFNRINRMRQGR
jgi:predicted phage terminase large subunit-like protein